MHVFVVILALLSSILLVGAVLLQSPKAGSGLTGGISGLGTVQTLGVRRTGDFLSKTTAILAGLVMALCFIAQFTLPVRHKAADADKSILQKEVPASLPVNSLPQALPALPAPANTLPAAPAK
ncbi:MAG: preprotein translocase subunit SecG [Chlorobiaceae bacterium]|jgi:preprotein translocase subunit SecG|nr:preprotein translocase subunit SecG [Chlorobiaceae bacterium]NTW73510.1 preprotein translocase subunit SecG [Chlorobiaceae bacterium]